MRFRIKALPTPFGSLDGRNPDVVTKADLKNSTITASFGEDFDFNLNLRVEQFKIDVGGEASFICEGSELSAPAKRAVDRARRNSIIRISEIKTRAVGSSVTVNDALPASFTIL